MPVAHFYIDGVKMITRAIREPSHWIRLRSATPTHLGTIPVQGVGEFGPETMINLLTWVYELNGQVGPDEFKYIFATIQGSSEYGKPFRDSLDIGFVEPDENVNLHRLAEKLKDGMDLKKMLNAYYNST